MKNIFTIALGLLFLSTPAFAGNWMSKSKILASSIEAHQLEETCKSVSGEECFDVGSNPSTVYSELILKDEVEECADEDDCDDKFALKECSSIQWEKIKNYDLLEVYCVKPSIELDQVKLASHQAALVIQAQAASLASSMAQVKALRECGATVIDLLVLRNYSKNLSTAQVKQLVASYAEIQMLIQAVSLVSAKEEIQAVVADGVLITEDDKTALISKINGCLGL